MVVDQSSFPNIQPSGFVHAISGNKVDLQLNPPECFPLAVGYDTPQSGYAGLAQAQGRSTSPWRFHQIQFGPGSSQRSVKIFNDQVAKLKAV